MSITKEIEAAREQALKDGDKAKRQTLTTLIGEITTHEKREGRTATDKEVVKILTRFRENAQENMQIIQQRVMDKKAEFVEYQAVLDEIIAYDKFIPAAKKQLSAEALHRVVRATIASRLASDCAKPKMGVIINDIKLLHDGEYDPKALTPLVKAELEATADPDKKA